jgi:hypothetical protein
MPRRLAVEVNQWWKDVQIYADAVRSMLTGLEELVATRG